MLCDLNENHCAFLVDESAERGRSVIDDDDDDDETDERSMCRRVARTITRKDMFFGV
jgi:hypothetical protein